MSINEKIKHKIDYEIKLINKECEVLGILIKKANNTKLDEIELRAAAASLQSVYNGLEKIIIQIFKHNDFSIPNSRSWHSDLLKDSIEKSIISIGLENSLRDYMGFRHFVRHAYGFMLDADLIKPLLLNLDNTIKDFIKEIQLFICKS